jgi:hypothetical protein
MRKPILCAALALAVTAALAQSTCYFSHETVSGLNKTCFYNCVRGSTAITIGAAQLCPLTIQR